MSLTLKDHVAVVSDVFVVIVVAFVSDITVATNVDIIDFVSIRNHVVAVVFNVAVVSYIVVVVVDDAEEKFDIRCVKLLNFFQLNTSVVLESA